MKPYFEFRASLRIPNPRAYWHCLHITLKMAWYMWRRLTLRRNMLKGQWQQSHTNFLLDRAQGELNELRAAVSWPEAADVANMVAMAADNGPMEAVEEWLGYLNTMYREEKKAKVAG